MAFSPNISFVPHDVSRLTGKRFEQRSRMSGLTLAQWHVLTYLCRNEGIQAGGLVERRPNPADRGAWPPYLTPEAHPSLEIMRANGQETRDEAFVGLSQDEQQHPLQTLCLIKSNLLEACIPPAVDREKIHG